MLLVDYYPQMIAMLNAGVGNIEGIKERESFQTFLEMGLENLGQKFIVQFREESFVEFNIAQYLRKKMVPPEFMVKMMRDNYGKRSSIIDVSIRNYSNTYVDLRLFQFTNKAALDSDLSFRKK